MSSEQEKRDIGQRVREAMVARYGGMLTQAAVAELLEISPDAFSRSLSGDRAFSSAELARVAHAFDADLHFLITGRPDPVRAVFAARHSFNSETFEYQNEGHGKDQIVRDGVLLAYRQSHPWMSQSAVDMPSTATECRSVLGEGFAPDFADLIEERFGVDVVRLPGLSTDYSLSIAGQQVILLNTEANWFRSNWSLAHELAHLCLGHHEVDATHADAKVETAANAFAAELLLPAGSMRHLDWTAMSPADVAQFIWDTGVSTATLRNRLRALGLSVTEGVSDGLMESTQRFLNRHPISGTTSRRVGDSAHGLVTVVDPIGDRMRRAAERRVPPRLMKALRDGIASGRLNTGTLAWLLDVDPTTLELDEPDRDQELSIEELANLLGI